MNLKKSLNSNLKLKSISTKKCCYMKQNELKQKNKKENTRQNKTHFFL